MKEQAEHIFHTAALYTKFPCDHCYMLTLVAPALFTPYFSGLPPLTTDRNGWTIVAANQVQTHPPTYQHC